MYVDQYWETSDSDHPLVIINCSYAHDPPGFCPEGSVVVYNGHKRWGMKREQLLRPSGKGPDDIITEARAFIAGRVELCDPKCKGWNVFHVNREHGFEIQKCDECMHGTGSTDEHFVALPEAQVALAKERAGPKTKP